VRKRSAVLLVLLPTLGGCGGNARAPSRPAARVVLVTCDTLRADRLGAYGYARPTSPNVDAFAREGVLFERAYSTAPWTGPALCALHTGKLPDEVGVPGGNRLPLPPQSVTLAELAREGGCATAAIVSNWVLRRPDPRLGDAGLPQGFEHFDDKMTAKETNRDLYERVAPDTTAAAVDWLQAAKRAGRDRFFLWVHYQDPHGPYQPPADIAPRFERPMTPEPDLRLGETIKGKGQIPSYQAVGGERRPEAYRSRYDAEIAYFDAHFGRLIEELRRLDWYEDALIVFTSDHGESLGEHDYWFCHGENLYDEVVRVPLIVRFPRNARHVRGTASERGERVRMLASHLDLWPTVLESLGLASRPNRGVSLYRDALPARRVTTQTLAAPQSPRRWEAVSDGTHRLVIPYGAAPQLYDVFVDPAETKDLAPSDPDRVADLLRRSKEYREAHRSVPLQELHIEMDERTRKGLNSLGYASDGDH